MPAEPLSQLLLRLGHRFGDPGLVTRALTHRSCGAKNNERLEFLGDSVLGVVIAATLFDRFPRLSEGELTRTRARLVRKETLAKLGRELEIGSHLLLGPGEMKSGGHDRGSILADALEALFGAVYVDAGFEAARKVILHVYQDSLDHLDPGAVDKDPKTRLQEYLQARGEPPPTYHLDQTSGAGHQQAFSVLCHVPGIEKPISASGRSRRIAEQLAAEKALQKLAPLP